jgi:HSP20 family molecular chaperone IbpA
MTRDIFLLDNLFDAFFFNVPKDLGKPPVDLLAFKDEAKKFHLQMAVAGYTEDEIRVSFEGRVLKIEGDNTKNDKVSPKFKSKFQRIWTVQEGVDLESAEVTFENGLLDICIQEKPPKSIGKLLFGK